MQYAWVVQAEALATTHPCSSVSFFMINRHSNASYLMGTLSAVLIVSVKNAVKMCQQRKMRASSPTAASKCIICLEQPWRNEGPTWRRARLGSEFEPRTMHDNATKLYELEGMKSVAILYKSFCVERKGTGNVW